jgi:hypothetical protein
VTQGEVVVQAAVAAAFVVVEAEALLELAAVVLDAPSELGQQHEPLEPGVRSQVREPVLDRQELRRYLRLGADHRVGAEAACEIYLVVAVHPPQPITTRMPVSSQPPPTM